MFLGRRGGRRRLRNGWRLGGGLRFDFDRGLCGLLFGARLCRDFFCLTKRLGLGLGAILLLATLLIVANTIRLGVVARADELEILALVGASRGFVSVPFLLEGLLQGVAGGVLALLLLFGLFQLVLPGFAFGLELLLGGAVPEFFSASQALALVVGGALLGGIGSGTALLGGLRA